MRKILFILAILILTSSAFSQVPTNAIYPRWVSALPATCTPTTRTAPLVIYKYAAPIGFYYCSATNTWTRISDLPTPAGMNFFPYFDASGDFVASPFTWDGTRYDFGGGTNLEMAFTPGSAADGQFTVGRFSGAPNPNVGLTINGTTGDATLQADGTILLQGTTSVDGTLSIGGGTALTTSNQTGTDNLVLSTNPTFGASAIFTGLTASQAVFTNGSKSLVSVATTGTGNAVLATSPTLTTPVLGAASATSINLGGATVTDILTGTASLDYAQALANTCETITLTVSGAIDGNAVQIGVPTALAAHNTTSTFAYFVSAADTVSVRRCVITADGSDPAAASIRAVVTQF